MQKAWVTYCVTNNLSFQTDLFAESELKFRRSVS